MGGVSWTVGMEPVDRILAAVLAQVIAADRAKNHWWLLKF